jgi:hypothetical protein
MRRRKRRRRRRGSQAMNDVDPTHSSLCFE